jgi:hypothetical protein
VTTENRGGPWLPARVQRQRNTDTLDALGRIFWLHGRLGRRFLRIDVPSLLRAWLQRNILGPLDGPFRIADL